MQDVVWLIALMTIAFGAGYGTREMISRRRNRRYARWRLKALFNAQETNAPWPAVLPAKSGLKAIERWTLNAIEFAVYIMISILLAAIGFVMLAHLMGHKLTA